MRAALAAALAGMLLGPCVAAAAGQRPPLKIGVSLALTGPDARWDIPMLRGVELGVEEANRNGGPGGHALETVVLDSAGPGLEGISRWRGMNNYERLIADPAVIAVIGPQTSGEGRAVAPLLSRADLATITPSSTTFDITDPALTERFRPGGRAVYFRTVGTDLAQAEAMADFAHRRLGVHRLVLVDDGRDFGERMVAGMARRARELGMTVLGRKRLSWRIGDHRRELRELQALEPEALYYAGGYQVGSTTSRTRTGSSGSVRRRCGGSPIRCRRTTRTRATDRERRSESRPATRDVGRDDPLTGPGTTPILRPIMRLRDTGRTGYFGYYFSYRLPGGPMP